MNDEATHANEQALLGCILSGYPIEDLPITGADFYQPRHEAIWDACRAIAAEGKKPDPQLVAAKLGTDLTKNGGHVYLIDLLGSTGVASNAGWYAEQVADAADRRWIRESATKIAAYADNPAAVPELIEACRAIFDKPRRHQAKASDLAALVPSLIDRVQHGTTKGLSTPWPDVDRWIRGMQPGRVYVIGARPGVGKSLLGQNLAAHFAHVHGKACFVSSIEMPETELGIRFLAAESGVDQGAMETATLTERQWAMLAGATERLQRVRISIADDSWQTMASIRSAARDAARRGNLGLIVIDYLQLVKPRDQKIPREQQVAEISRDCKRLAKELDVPLVALAQLNRAGAGRADKTPTLTDLRESGAIEADADVVLLLHREDDATQECQVRIAKNRSGPLGSCELHIQGHIARVVSATRY